MAPASQSGRLYPRWGRLVATAIAGLVFIYLGLVCAGFAFIRFHRGVESARFVDALFPQRWPRIRIAQGNHAIDHGISLAFRGQLREAVTYLGSGLKRAPDHRRGRLLYAEILAAANRNDLARDVLIEGLAFHGTDAGYLGKVFGFLLDRQDDERVLHSARQILQAPGSMDVAKVASLAAATASFQRGNYDQAEEFLRHLPKVENSPEGQLLVAKIDWERGYRDLALLRLRALSEDYAGDAAVHRELMARLRQLGLNDEARRRAVAFQLAHPTLPAPRVELLHAYHQSGDSARIIRETDSILRDFASDRTALLAVADFAAYSGNAALAQQLLAHARRHNLPWEAHAFLHIEALLVARDYPAALAALRAYQDEERDWAQQYPGLLASLQAVAYLGTGERENGRLFLNKFLDQPALRTDNLLTLANRFVDLDAADDACRILARATALDPLNQAALSRLIELELNLNRIDELPAHLLRLVEMRKPSPDVLRVAHHKLGSDLFLFSAGRSRALEAVQRALEQAETRAAPARLTSASR